MRDLENWTGGTRRGANHLSGLLGLELGVGRCSSNIGIGEEKLVDLGARLLALQRLFGRVARQDDGREHGVECSDSVFGRHCIGNILRTTLSIVHCGEHKVRDDLETQSDSRGHREHLCVRFLACLVSPCCRDRKVTVRLGGSVQLEHTICILSVLAFLLHNIRHEFSNRLGSGAPTLWECRPVGVKEGTGHGGLEALEVALGHDWFHHIDSSGLDKCIFGDGPLSKVENDKQGEIFQAVGSPAGRRGGRGTNVLDNTFGDLSLANESRVLLTLGKVLDEATGPTDTFGLSRTRFRNSRGVGQELLKDTEERFRVF
mmetsp:Transcript_23322/g.54165  ORF Transcript_23322/g.54165 Transcript_23322/m.54165 type:complete len:316 (+) Transcript_23322:276-1223(+)